uniref:CSON011476 protein n=1 Tax=Culicoides sonorensis TaxID=179676 RepID=A0A336LUC3_CULSO
MALPNQQPGHLDPLMSAPKFGTLIPNRVFVGGISGDTTESELCRVFSAFGNVKSTKIIVDRAGISKGYGFVTFETEQEAQRLQNEAECVVLHDRKLNIAPAIKKQSVSTPNGTMFYAGSPAIPLNIPIDQYAVYPSTGLPTLYPAGIPYQQFYPYYSLPMQNVQTIWPQNYQGKH